MSEKELLYVEDILSHLQNMDDYLNNYLIGLEDANFKSTLEDLQGVTKSVYKKFYKLIEE